MKREIKKKIQKVMLPVFALAWATTLASGYTPKIVNHALYTDIVATINDIPLRSYNIDGYTAVVAEDLRSYGCDVVWDGTERTLKISRSNNAVTGTSYTPEPLGKHRIGERAKAVYATDIVTYVDGNKVESYNINGETLIWMDDLAAFGAVSWDPNARKISATFTPARTLQSAIADLVAWRDMAGAGSTYKTWESKNGTLLYTCYTGTPHGSMESLLFFKNNGEEININALFSGTVSAPRNIELDEAGNTLRLVVLLTELSPEDGSQTRGDKLCTIDLNAGTILQAMPYTST